MVPSGQPHKSFEETYRDALRDGEFDTGYHFFIDSMGVIHEDRNDESVACCDFENYDKAVYVLLEAHKRPNDCQEVTLRELREYLEDKYGTLEVVQDDK